METDARLADLNLPDLAHLLASIRSELLALGCPRYVVEAVHHASAELTHYVHQVRREAVARAQGAPPCASCDC